MSNLKLYEKAIPDFTKAWELSNRLIPKYIYNRGWAKLKLGNKDEACSDFQVASDMNFQIAKTNVEKHCK